MTGVARPVIVHAGPWVKPALTGLIFSIITTAWGAWAAGRGLPLFFGAILLTVFYVPALTIAEPPLFRWIPPLTAAIGITFCWFTSLHFVDASIIDLFRCALICLTFTFALAGIAAALSRIYIPPSTAAFLVTIVALLWLTWPVWLSHALTQSRVNLLTPAHPLLAINGVLHHLGSWDRATLAYQRLTILNQDIPYTLPRSIFPTVTLHTLIAAVCFGLSVLQFPRSRGSAPN
jgi:hypothetical protein